MVDDDQKKCEGITAGNIYSNDPNGAIQYTKSGPLLTISKSLEYFVKFMNLSILEFGDEVPLSIRTNALRIGLRIMFRTEALDFQLDPRGIIPKKILDVICGSIYYQYLFIAGHEYSHYILGHLRQGSIVRMFPKVKSIIGDSKDRVFIDQYNFSQKEEMNADLYSITKINHSERTLNLIIEFTLLWFFQLHIYEYALDIVKPKSPYAFNTHPSALDRF